MRTPSRIFIAALAALTVLSLPAPSWAAAIRRASPASPAPCPWESGRRVTRPGAPVYLVDAAGYLRGIPNPATYDNLFPDWNGITEDLHLDLCAIGAELTDGASLITAKNRRWFLLTGGVRHGITDVKYIAKYYFDASKVKVLPVAVLDSIPEGSVWE